MFFGLKSRFLSAGPVGELAETTSLLRTRSRKVTEGSNPSLSAILLCIFFFHDFIIIILTHSFDYVALSFRGFGLDSLFDFIHKQNF